MTNPAAWALLVCAGFLDVAWAISVKEADGYTRTGWTIASLVLLASFIILLGKAVQVLPVGTAYAVWTGIGAVGTAMLGIALYGETASALRLAGIATVLGGIILLKIAPP